VIARTRPATTAGGLRVTVLSGPDAGRTLAVSHPCIVGRSETADLRLTDATASSFHVELTATANGVAVRDLESMNGVVHAGGFIERGTLPSGSSIELGTSVVRIELDSTPARPASELSEFGSLRSSTAAMRGLFALLGRVSPSELSILVEGSATETDPVAEAIHEASARASGPLVRVDCAALPAKLGDSMLFGNASHPGALEAAQGGTLFLRNLSELAPELQAKVLRTIDTRTLTRSNATASEPLHVRFVSASARDLRVVANQGKFHEDLYDRLAQVRVRIPTLRERSDDIPALAYSFLQRLPPEVPAARTVSREAMSELRRRDYPGGVRELRELVERAALVATGTSITPSDLAFERLLQNERARATSVISGDVGDVEAAAPGDALAPFKEAKRTLVDEFEREYLTALLARCGQNLSRAAIVSGVERHHLRDLFRKHGLRGKET
jgi:DNA-binding NtrC family response regulator